MIITFTRMDKISIIIMVVKLLFVYPMFMGPLDLLISLPLGKGIMVLNCVFIISHTSLVSVICKYYRFYYSQCTINDQYGNGGT